MEGRNATGTAAGRSAITLQKKIDKNYQKYLFQSIGAVFFLLRISKLTKTPRPLIILPLFVVAGTFLSLLRFHSLYEVRLFLQSFVLPRRSRIFDRSTSFVLASMKNCIQFCKLICPHILAKNFVTWKQTRPKHYYYYFIPNQIFNCALFLNYLSNIIAR